MFDPSQFSYQQQQQQSQPQFVNYGAWTPIGYHSVAQPAPEINQNTFWANTGEAKRCDICNVDCNNKDALEKHLLGKKHKATLNNQFTSFIPNQIAIVGPSSSTTSSLELELKKIKVVNSGAALDSVRVCNICNVVCNSLDVFNKHMLGKKHSIQANLAALGVAGPYFAAIRAQFEGSYNNKKAPKKVKIVQSAWCNVCKIRCNSSDAYATHLAGKKHIHNLEQQNRSNHVIGPEENPELNIKTKIVAVAKKTSEEDLFAKRQKIVQTGTAAAMVRTCTVCNVVCNSLTVFNSHLGGQKHKDMLLKFQQSFSSAV